MKEASTFESSSTERQVEILVKVITSGNDWNEGAYRKGSFLCQESPDLESLKYPLDTKFDQMKQSLVEQKNAFPIDKRQIVTREFSNWESQFIIRSD